jgi:hypothetical protein
MISQQPTKFLLFLLSIAPVKSLFTSQKTQKYRSYTFAQNMHELRC